MPFSLPLGAASPAYHPAGELLLEYAAGAGTGAETIMIATHLACCRLCREAARVGAEAGGALLDALPPARLPPDMLNRALAAIDAAPATAQATGAVSRPPMTLDDYLALQDWKKLPGGFRMRRISDDDRSGAGRIWLFDAPPGMALLPHRHAGDEWTVILRGVFVDQNMHYGPGDFACMADGEEHRPMVGGDERCVSLIMVRQNPRYTTVLGKLSSPFVKL